MKFIKTKDCEKQSLQDHEKILPSDFFKTNFCFDPPSYNKTVRIINRVVKKRKISQSKYCDFTIHKDNIKTSIKQPEPIKQPQKVIEINLKTFFPKND